MSKQLPFPECLKALQVRCSQEAQQDLLNRLISEVALESVGRQGGQKAYCVEDVADAIADIRERYGLKSSQATIRILAMPVVPAKGREPSLTKQKFESKLEKLVRLEKEKDKAEAGTKIDRVPTTLADVCLRITNTLGFNGNVLVSPEGKCMPMLAEMVSCAPEQLIKAVNHLEGLGVIELTIVPRVGTARIHLVNPRLYRAPEEPKKPSGKKGVKYSGIHTPEPTPLMVRIEQYIWDRYDGEMYRDDAGCTRELAEALGVPRVQVSDAITRLRKTQRVEPPVARPGTGTFLIRCTGCKTESRIAEIESAQ